MNKPKRIKYTLEKFIEKGKEVHKDFYSYDKASFQKLAAKIEITCPKHGSFWQTAQDHILGSRCPQCYNEERSSKVMAGKGGTLENFLKKAKEVHGDLYDYSRSVYKGNLQKIEIGCKTHGFFWQLAGNHANAGSGCLECGKEKGAAGRTYTTEEFIEIAKSIHGDKYDYSKSIYSGIYCQLEIICQEHGAFSQAARDHLQGSGCQHCGKIVSGPQAELQGLLESTGFEVQLEYTLQNNHRIDLYIPSVKIGIEYNGLHWHSDRLGRISSTYHLDKTLAAKKEGIHLIHIFEDDWINHNQRTSNWLLSQLGIVTDILNARDLSVIKKSWIEVKDFIEQIHIQGQPAPASDCYALITETGEIVAAMLFSAKNRLEGEIELEKFCTKGRIRGGFSKLLKAFLRDKGSSFNKVISFSDKSWSKGDVYLSNGFICTGQTPPRYFWTKGQKRYNRRGFQKQYLAKLLPNFNSSLTEDENCRNHGYAKIYDCGLDKWELKLK